MQRSAEVRFCAQPALCARAQFRAAARGGNEKAHRASPAGITQRHATMRGGSTHLAILRLDGPLCPGLEALHHLAGQEHVLGVRVPHPRARLKCLYGERTGGTYVSGWGASAVHDRGPIVISPLSRGGLLSSAAAAPGAPLPPGRGRGERTSAAPSPRRAAMQASAGSIKSGNVPPWCTALHNAARGLGHHSVARGRIHVR